jgi:hypothetical protein
MAETLAVSSTSPGVVFLHPSSRANIEVTSSGVASKRSSEPVNESPALAPSSQPSEVEKTTIKPGQESVDMSIGALINGMYHPTEIQSVTLGPKVENRTDHQSGQSHAPRQVSKAVFYCCNCGDGPLSVFLNSGCPNCGTARCQRCPVVEQPSAKTPS